MRDRDAVLDQSIHEVSVILGEAGIHLLVPDPAVRQVGFPETESPPVTAGFTP